MHFRVITIFQDICQVYTDASILGRAQKTEKGKGAKVKGKKISISYYNPRDFSKDKNKKVDERPYGGGPGMVGVWQKKKYIFRDMTLGIPYVQKIEISINQS